MPSTRLLNEWTHRFNTLLGATWLGQRDEYWVIDQAPKDTPRGGIFRGSQRHNASPSVPRPIRRNRSRARGGAAAQRRITICLICSTTSGFISVVTSPTSSDSFESAARTRRMILPERVLGMSGTR